MTDISHTTIFYDGACRLCRASAVLGRALLPARRFHWKTLQAGAGDGDLPQAGAWREMLLRTPRGRIYGGADALFRMADEVPWLVPLRWLGATRRGRQISRRAYRWMAANRGCVQDRCHRPRRIGPGTAIFFAGYGAGVAGFSLPGPRWMTMWLIALGVFGLGKWLTLRLAERPGDSLPRKLAYLLLWAGMDAPSFLRGKAPSPPAPREWLGPIGRTALGAALIWVVARHCQADMLRGWVGLFGLILLLHFGLIHLLALVWRRGGIDARPIMDRPLAASSLGEFWGRRWNRGFTDLVTGLLFRPVARLTSGRCALLAVFLFSGLVHELVISVPAGGGYGLPTGYFLIQGTGVLFERSRPGRRIAGRGFTFLLTAGPLFWLFHPPFVREIALSMLRALHAL